MRFFATIALATAVRLYAQKSPTAEQVFEACNTNKDQKLDYQIVSPGNHRTNPAEQAIRDFKAHFISTRACWDKNYPANAWDKVIPHVLHTLNMLRPSNIRSTIDVASSSQRGLHSTLFHMFSNFCPRPGPGSSVFPGGAFSIFAHRRWDSGSKSTAAIIRQLAFHNPGPGEMRAKAHRR